MPNAYEFSPYGAERLLYTMDRGNGQIIGARSYIDNINWTKGIDQKTGKPLD